MTWFERYDYIYVDDTDENDFYADMDDDEVDYDDVDMYGWFIEKWEMMVTEILCMKMNLEVECVSEGKKSGKPVGRWRYLHTGYQAGVKRPSTRSRRSQLPGAGWEIMEKEICFMLILNIKEVWVGRYMGGRRYRFFNTLLKYDI